MLLRSDQDLLTLLKYALKEAPETEEKNKLTDFLLLTTLQKETRKDIITYLMASQSDACRKIYKIHECATRNLIIEELAMMRATQKHKQPAYPIKRSEGAIIFRIVHAAISVIDPGYQEYYQYVDLGSIAPKYISRDPIDLLLGLECKQLEDLRQEVNAECHISSQISSSYHELLNELTRLNQVNGKIQTTPQGYLKGKYTEVIKELSPEEAKIVYEQISDYMETNNFKVTTKKKEYIKRQLSIILENIKFPPNLASNEQPAQVPATVSGSTTSVILSTTSAPVLFQPPLQPQPVPLLETAVSPSPDKSIFTCLCSFFSALPQKKQSIAEALRYTSARIGWPQ